MDSFYSLLENKFSSILSGNCLTNIREENKKIASKYTSFDENNYFKIKDDFINYFKNYLFLKGYTDISSSDFYVSGKFKEELYVFSILFDYTGTSSEFSLKILDKGGKFGISNSECKYGFIISIEKGIFFMINLDKLRSQIKENRSIFNIITENQELFESKYVVFNLEKINQKTKIFTLK